MVIRIISILVTPFILKEPKGFRELYTNGSALECQEFLSDISSRCCVIKRDRPV